MPRPADIPLIKPSDATSWSQCRRRVWLEHYADLGFAAPVDAFSQHLIESGIAHEQAVYQRLASTRDVQRATSAEQTSALMAKGVEVIYQARLVDKDNGITGSPDFLIRHPGGEYQPADAKLSHTADKQAIQIQLGLYRRMLGARLPGIVYLGNGEQALVGDEANEVTENYITDMRNLLASRQQPQARYSHSKCNACAYREHCTPEFEACEELSLLYGINIHVAEGLEQVGIQTISQLAASDPADIPDLPHLKNEGKKRRAVLQAKAWLSGEVFQIAPLAMPAGHWVHFDIEANPPSDGMQEHVYLWGFLPPGYQHSDYTSIWTDQGAEDESGWRQFLEQIALYRQRYPDLVLVHYSNYERTTIRNYARRYGMESNHVVVYLLGPDSPLFDIQKVVKNSLVLPLQGFGLKDICKHKQLVDFQWQDEVAGSQWSVVQFRRFVEQQDATARQQLKNSILKYNCDDVIATRRLEQWLRANFEVRIKGVSVD